MSIIEKTHVVSSDMKGRMKNMGKSVPPWYPNYQDVNNWYWSSSDPPDYAFFFNDVGDDVYVQYGKNETGWASARFFGQTLKIIEEQELPNGDIKVKVDVKANFFNGHKNNIATAGYAVKYTVKINNVVQYTFTGNTIDSFSHGSRPSQVFEVTVKPQQTTTRTAMIVDIEYPNGEFPDRQLIVGFGLFNPNPVTYVPMSIRKSGSWKDLNSNNGKILIRKSSSWTDKSYENTETSRQENKGKNRIRRAGIWRQLPKMTGGKAD